MMELPESWAVEPFSQVARYTTGRTPARANPAYWVKDANQVPWAAISDMEEYGILTETKESVSEAAFEDVFRERIVPAGTLLMSFKLTIGRVATLGVPACHNEAIISIYPRQGVDQRYLGYFLSQVDYTDHQDRQIKGNTLNQSKIDQIQIMLPPSEEQASIADVLDKCRLGLNTERAAEATAQELKRAAMRELFTRGLRGETQKETAIGLVPENWDFISLGDAYETQLGKMLSQKAHGGDSPKPYLRNKNVQWGRLDLADLLVMDFDEREAVKFKLMPGDLLVCEGGIIGRAAIWRGELGECYYQKALHRVRPRSEDASNAFLCQWLSFSFEHQNFYNIGGASSTIAHLPQVLLDGLKIPLPRPNEQREIVAILDAIDRKIALHRQKRAVLGELFQSLLHKLMTCEIRVADLDLSALPAVTAAA
ncbi:hypothetical protein AGMMS50225_08980 [Betaproteobacteria bacterium]|nr:hypothetical protein AGMMS50225_08980 [Betaproteobacteria bacterium]